MKLYFKKQLNKRLLTIAGKKVNIRLWYYDCNTLRSITGKLRFRKNTVGKNFVIQDRETKTYLSFSAFSPRCFYYQLIL